MAKEGTACEFDFVSAQHFLDMPDHGLDGRPSTLPKMQDLKRDYLVVFKTLLMTSAEACQHLYSGECLAVSHR